MTDNWLSGIERQLASNFPPKSGGGSIQQPIIQSARRRRSVRSSMSSHLGLAETENRSWVGWQMPKVSAGRFTQPAL
jgi:hypothetical protein